jgi:hypothetical protein
MVLPTGFCLGTFGVSYANLHDAARLIDELRFDHADPVLCGNKLRIATDVFIIFIRADPSHPSRSVVYSFRTDPSHPCPSMCSLGHDFPAKTHR